jgi:hypothetical protein
MRLQIPALLSRPVQPSSQVQANSATLTQPNASSQTTLTPHYSAVSAGNPSRRAIATRAHPRADIGRAIVWHRAIPAELSVRSPRRRGGARVPTTTVSGTGIGGYSGFPVPLVPPLPPEPVKFPRQRLNQRFAVLLLRSVRGVGGRAEHPSWASGPLHLIEMSTIHVRGVLLRRREVWCML